MAHNFRVYGYLRASAKEQDALRAKDEVAQFAKQSDLTIASFFVEHESGATLNRPELFRLLDIAQPDDIILVEQIDRISRLNDKDWNKLKTIIKSIKVILNSKFFQTIKLTLAGPSFLTISKGSVMIE